MDNYQIELNDVKADQVAMFFFSWNNKYKLRKYDLTVGE